MDWIGNFTFEKLSSIEVCFTRLQNCQTRPDSSGVGLGAGFGGFYYRCFPTVRHLLKSSQGLELKLCMCPISLVALDLEWYEMTQLV